MNLVLQHAHGLHLLWTSQRVVKEVALQAEELRKQHQAELRAQIAARDEERRLAVTKTAAEGAALRSAAAAKLSRLEAIKAAKLAELRDAGVPAKYCAELAKYKVGRSGT